MNYILYFTFLFDIINFTNFSWWSQRPTILCVVCTNIHTQCNNRGLNNDIWEIYMLNVLREHEIIGIYG